MQPDLQRIVELTRETASRKEEYQITKNSRDDAIRDAITSGRTMYAIAKASGLSNSAIAAIRDANQPPAHS